MVPVMEAQLSALLERLRVDISEANHPGNAEGLLARHFLGEDVRLGFDWQVDCDETWLSEFYDPSSLPSVAALGFTVRRRGSEVMRSALKSGLARAVSRDATAASQNVTLHSPPVLVGLVLAAEQFKESAPHYLSWCREVIQALRAASSGGDTLTQYASTLTGAPMSPIPELEDGRLVELAVQDWLLSLPGTPPVMPARRKALKQALVEQALREDAGGRTANEAALIWRAIHNAISEATSDILRSPETVLHMLEQFEASMKRWRWDSQDLKSPVRWPILSEREVQDILYLMLRPVFLDVEDEDALPKFGHSTYRADFGIPSLSLLIEVKYARSAAAFKDIEKEVLEDIVPYLQTPERYNRIIVFIYDDSASVQVHETTARALRRAPGIAGVVIVSRASQLPADQTKSQPANKNATRRVPSKPAKAKAVPTMRKGRPPEAA